MNALRPANDNDQTNHHIEVGETCFCCINCQSHVFSFRLMTNEVEIVCAGCGSSVDMNDVYGEPQ